MGVYLVLLKLFAVLIGLMFIFYAIAAVVVAVTLGTLETLRQGWELEEKELARASSKRTRRQR
jgi:hypothetical protein